MPIDRQQVHCHIGACSGATAAHLRGRLGRECHIRWEILDSWTDRLSQDNHEVAQVPLTPESLIFELFGAAHGGRLDSKRCQVAICHMSGLLLSAGEIHPGITLQLGKAFVQEISSQADVSLEVGAAFWQLMTIVEQRWQSPHQAIRNQQVRAGLLLHPKPLTNSTPWAAR
jgi:hypothetical protein